MIAVEEWIIYYKIRALIEEEGQTMDKTRTQQVLDTGILAGRILMESGSEMYRIEDTLKYILHTGGLTKPEIFTTPTGIFLSAQNIDITKMAQVTHSNINLEKVNLVNALSRQFSAGEITLDQLEAGLKQIDHSTRDFPFWWKLLSSFFISCFLMIIFIGKYDWLDFVPAGIVGMLGYGLDYYLNEILKVQFISEFIAGAAIALMAVGFQYLGLAKHINYLIIGAVMPLVPGVALTNALRDLISGHLISGLTRMVAGTLTALAIGGGIALILRFLA